jgi:pimeloyl-ACP methyl ester carboxylesterase
MMRESKTKYLHYKKYGSGQKFLLAFHGFGQDESAFRMFAQSLGDQYTILSFDILFHGQSRWPADELPVPEAEWVHLLEQVLTKEGIERFALLGYSLGGKLALYTSLAMSTKVEKVMLVAADGIYPNPWYKVATGTGPMRFVFRYLTERPAFLGSVIKVISRFGLIPEKLGRFAISQVTNEKNGHLIYASWVGFRLFSSNLSVAIDKLTRANIPLTIVAGRYDSVIPYKKLKAFAQKCPTANFILMNTGHNSLLKKYHEMLLSSGEN